MMVRHQHQKRYIVTPVYYGAKCLKPQIFLATDRMAKGQYGGYTNILTPEHFTENEDYLDFYVTMIEDLVELANTTTDHKYLVDSSIPWTPSELKIYEDFDPTFSPHGRPDYYVNNFAISVKIRLNIALRAVVDGEVYELPPGSTGQMYLASTGLRRVYFFDGLSQAVRVTNGGALKSRRGTRKMRRKLRKTRKN